MMCTTVIHGGVCHRTSTPHKSGIKMKEKKSSLFLPRHFGFLKSIQCAVIAHMGKSVPERTGAKHSSGNFHL